MTGDDLLQVVRHKTATAGSLDGRGCRELKSLPVPWFDELARILAKVEELGVWPEGCWNRILRWFLNLMVMLLLLVSVL